MAELALMYMDFIINFFILFAILINILLLIAAVFKTKDYALELLILGMISFVVFLGIHQFMNLSISSYTLAGQEEPFGESVISEMFLLMASMLIFAIAATKNRLQSFKLGSRK